MASPTPEPTFGMSTLVCGRQPLRREHLLAFAAHGFRAVELRALRSHLDYHRESAVGDLQAWLADAGLTLDAVHAPVAEPAGGGRPDAALSLASPDAAARAHALEEAAGALHLARRIPVRVLVVHLGPPRAAPGETSREGARRSLETLRDLAAPLGVRVVVEVLDNELSRPASLAHFLERDVGPEGLGICLDLGHAHLDAGVVDAVELVAEHLAAVDVHDNRGRSDDHALPFDGTIDWAPAITTLQKVGYDGPLTFEPAPRGDLAGQLARAEGARRKLERYLTM